MPDDVGIGLDVLEDEMTDDNSEAESTGLEAIQIRKQVDIADTWVGSRY